MDFHLKLAEISELSCQPPRLELPSSLDRPVPREGGLASTFFQLASNSCNLSTRISIYKMLNNNDLHKTSRENSKMMRAICLVPFLFLGCCPRSNSVVCAQIWLLRRPWPFFSYFEPLFLLFRANFFCWSPDSFQFPHLLQYPHPLLHPNPYPIHMHSRMHIHSNAHRHKNFGAKIFCTTAQKFSAAIAVQIIFIAASVAAQAEFTAAVVAAQRKLSSSGYN